MLDYVSTHLPGVQVPRKCGYNPRYIHDLNDNRERLSIAPVAGSVFEDDTEVQLNIYTIATQVGMYAYDEHGRRNTIYSLATGT